jgi:type II secretion system protein G
MKANIFRNKANLTRGFTLIELLVVVSIIGMLASVVLVSLQGARNKARDIKLIAEVKELQKALELYRLDNGAYPGALGGTYSTSVEPVCPGAKTGTLASIFDQNFRTKYMPTFPTELASCGIFYAVYSGASDVHSLACAPGYGNVNSDTIIHPDGFNGAVKWSLPSPHNTIPNGVGVPTEAYSYVILIKTIANPPSIPPLRPPTPKRSL